MLHETSARLPKDPAPEPEAALVFGRLQEQRAAAAPKPAAKVPGKKAAAGKGPAPQAPDPTGALSREEQEVFCFALMELSDMAYQGLWHLGLDTDADIPDREGYPGLPIWHMDESEAQKVCGSFMVLGKHRPEVFKAMRAINAAHSHLQAGLIVGSRFFETGIRLFETGINFRLSKTAWTQSVKRMEDAAWQTGQTGPAKSKFAI
ncbi:hypothetical protein [Thiomonas sp.]